MALLQNRSFQSVGLMMALAGCTRGFPTPEVSEPRARITVADFVTRIGGLKGFVASSDVNTPATLESLSPQEVVGKLASVARIYNFDPKEYAFDQGTDCIADAMRDLRFKATRTTLLLQGTYDDSLCLGAETGRLKSSNTIYVAIACSGASFYAYDGKTPTAADLKALSADNLCPEGNYAILTNSVSELTAVVNKPSTDFIPSKKVTATVMTKDGTACTFVVRNGLRQSLNECHEVTVERTYVNPALVKTDYYAERYDNLMAQLGGKFYVGGTKRIQLQNWKGAINFSGPNLTPEFEITNGSQALKGPVPVDGASLGGRSR
jgi:hypothetical protein